MPAGTALAGSASAAPPAAPQPASTSARRRAGRARRRVRGIERRLRTQPANCNPACRTFVCTPSCRRLGARRSRRRPTCERRLFAGKTCPRPNRDDAFVGRATTNVLQGGTEWGTVPLYSRSGVAGLLPLRHLGSTRLHRSTGHMSLGLQRQLRTHARREAPAHGAVEVPRPAGGHGVPREGSGSLHQRVSRTDLFGDDDRSPRRAQPVLARGARAAALLARQRGRRGARHGGPRDAAAGASRPRRHRSPGDDRGRGRRARALGSGRLAGLRHRPHGASG